MKTLIQRSGYRFCIAQSISGLESEWDCIGPSSVLLSSEYLEMLERYSPNGMQFKYALAYRGDQLLAAFYFQLIPFNAAERLKLNKSHRLGLRSCFYDHVKALVASQVDFVTLVCGNLLATGPYGFKANPALAPYELQDIFDQLLKALFEEPELIHRASVCLVKELPQESAFTIDRNLPLHFLHQFSVQPAMVFKIHPEWRRFEDYLSALESKYRLRIRKAMEASGVLQHRELHLSDIQIWENQLYAFYLRTAANADFNLVELHPGYFTGLKTALGDRYRVFGFFEAGELVAFYSSLDDGREMVGHFLGTSPKVNGHYQLYLNILIRYLMLGIEGHYDRIMLARTAIEMKSSVGATPEQMACYIGHRNKLYNRWVPSLLNYLSPQTDYTLRSPFKKATEETQK